MSIRLNFCRGVPPEFLRSFFINYQIIFFKNMIVYVYNKLGLCPIHMNRYSIILHIHYFFSTDTIFAQFILSDKNEAGI